MSMKIARNDIVEVIAGDDKGKRGRVLRVLRAEHRVVVEKVRLVKRHQRQNRQGVQSGIVEKEAAIDTSNVKLVERAQNRGVATPKAAKETPKETKEGKSATPADQEAKAGKQSKAPRTAKQKPAKEKPAKEKK